MKLTVIVGALVIALFAVVAVSNFFDTKPEEKQFVLNQAPQPIQPQVMQKNILVARQDIQIGTAMDANLYDIKPIAEQLIPPGAVLADDPNGLKIDGMITNTSIVTNQPILLTMLRNPNDPSYIAGQLSEGMRAVTIQVGLTQSLAGLITPGDKVDVLYTHDIKAFNAATAKLTSVKAENEEQIENASVNLTEVLIPNLKILAVDKNVGGTIPPEQQQAGVVPQSVTLEVNLRDAQKLLLAEKMGDLSLALRSVKDKDRFDIVRPTAEQDLSRAMAPAKFSGLYDSDAPYDFRVIGTSAGGSEGGSENSSKINVYKGSAMTEVEVAK